MTEIQKTKTVKSKPVKENEEMIKVRFTYSKENNNKILNISEFNVLVNHKPRIEMDEMDLEIKRISYSVDTGEFVIELE